MKRLAVKNYDIILWKLQKYQQYYQAKLINIDILQTKKILLSVPSQIVKNKVSLHTLLLKNPLNKKHKRLRIMEKNL